METECVAAKKKGLINADCEHYLGSVVVIVLATGSDMITVNC